MYTLTELIFKEASFSPLHVKMVSGTILKKRMTKTARSLEGRLFQLRDSYEHEEIVEGMRQILRTVVQEVCSKLNISCLGCSINYFVMVKHIFVYFVLNKPINFGLYFKCFQSRLLSLC